MATVACDTSSPLSASVGDLAEEQGGGARGEEEQLPYEVHEGDVACEPAANNAGMRSVCEVRGTWPGMVGAPLSPMPKRAKARIEEMMKEASEGRRSQRRHSIDSIEIRLKEAEQRRQQFHEWMAERARPKRRVIVREDNESDDEKAQRILAKISAAQKKKSERIAAKQRRLAAVNEQRAQRNYEASARAEREREELESRVESRFLQAESNRQALIEAERARVAAANSRKVQKLERLRLRAEEKLARATERLAAAEAKRNALLDAERSRASAVFAQARKVAQTVATERERETLERRQQLETKLLKARGRRELILGQRGGCSGACHTHGRPVVRHGDRLSRKLTRCWRQFRRRKTTLELAQDFSACNLSTSSVASLPFDVIASRITSQGTIRAVKAVLGRVESRLLASTTQSPAMSLEPLLRRLSKASAPPPRRTTRSASVPLSPSAAKGGLAPGGSTSASATEASPAPAASGGSVHAAASQCRAYTERYPTRVFLCAYMIIGHPDAVFSAKTSREEALAEAAGRLLPRFEALLAAVLEGPSGTPCLSCPDSPPSERDTSPLPSARGGAPPAEPEAASPHRLSPPATGARLPFSGQLAAFDSAWCEYLEQFVAWKVKDVRQMEDEMVRTACKLERSMLRRCGVLPTEDASHLRPDYQSMHKQVLVDQGLLQARIMRITGSEGVARMATAISELRASFLESRASTNSPFPSAPSSPLPTPPLARSPPSASALPPRALRRARSTPSTPPVLVGSPPLTDVTTSEDETSPMPGCGSSPSLTPPVRLVLPRQFCARRSSASDVPTPSTLNTPTLPETPQSEYHTPPSSPGRSGGATSSSPLASSLPPAGGSSTSAPQPSPKKTPSRSAFRFPSARTATATAPGAGAGKRKDPEGSPPGAPSPHGGERKGFDAAALARALTSGAVQLSSSSPSSSRKVADEVGGSAVASAALEVGLTNEKMVYELLHDRSWKLPEVKIGGEPTPNLDEREPMPEALEASPATAKADLKVRMRKMMEAAYWDSLQESLASEASVAAGASRVAGVVSEIRGQILEVAPSRMAKEISDSMDCELLEQILASGSMDFLHMGKLLEYAHALMLQLGAPARDEEARGAHQELLAELARATVDDGAPAGEEDASGATALQRARSKFARAVVQGLRFVFNRLKVLKRDVANARLSALAPVVQGHAGTDYMRSTFSERHGITLRSAHDSSSLDGRQLAESLPGTASWLIEAARLDAEAKDEILAALASAQATGAVDAAAERLAALGITTPRTVASGLPPASAMRTGSRVVRALPFSAGSSPASPGSSKARSPLANLSSPAAKEGLGQRAAVAWGSPAALVRAGLVAIAASQDSKAATPNALPETLRLDAARLHSIQDRFQKIAVTATGLLVARQGMSAKGIGGAAADAALMSGRPRLSSLLDSESVTVPQIGTLITAIVSEAAGGVTPLGGGGPAAAAAPGAGLATEPPAGLGASPDAASTQPSAEDLMVRLIGKALTPGDAIYTRIAAALSGALRAAVMLGGRTSPDSTAVVDAFLRKAGAVVLRDDIMSVAEDLEKVADVNLRVHDVFYRALR